MQARFCCANREELAKLLYSVVNFANEKAIKRREESEGEGIPAGSSRYVIDIGTCRNINSGVGLGINARKIPFFFFSFLLFLKASICRRGETNTFGGSSLPQTRSRLRDSTFDTLCRVPYDKYVRHDTQIYARMCMCVRAMRAYVSRAVISAEI